MSISKKYSEGNRGSDLSYRGRVLRGLQNVSDNTQSLGEVTSLLSSLITATQANSEDGEVLVVKDVTNDVIVVQVREYDKGTDTWTVRYENVGGGDYTPAISPATYEYQDATAILTSIKTVLDSIALDTATNLAKETTLSELKDLFIPTTRVSSLINVSGISMATAADGARSVTFFNAGTNNITVAGGTLSPGLSVTFTADGENDTLSPVAYETFAGSELVITELR